MAESTEILPKKVVIGIALFITLLFGISIIVDVLNPAYDPPMTLHLTMMAVAGAAFSQGKFQITRSTKEEVPGGSPAGGNPAGG